MNKGRWLVGKMESQKAQRAGFAFPVVTTRWFCRLQTRRDAAQSKGERLKQARWQSGGLISRNKSMDGGGNPVQRKANTTTTQTVKAN
jgi:hypothetical protein